MNAIYERINQVKAEIQQRQPQEFPNRIDGDQRRPARIDLDDDYYNRDGDSSQRRRRRPRREREGRGQRNDTLEGFKLKIPPFHGRNDRATYLEWKKKERAHV